MISRLFPALLCIALAACSMPVIDRDVRYTTLEPVSASSPVIEVEEFELATEVTRYPAPSEWLGVDIAQRTVAHLRAMGRRAKASARAEPKSGDLVVRGRIVQADGGSAKARSWAPGAGGAAFGVEVEVVSASGEVIDRFPMLRHSSRSLDSIMVVQYCVDRVGLDIAQRVTSSGGR